jgi:hypothetical protein
VLAAPVAVDISGQVNNYASAGFSYQSGQGSLIQNSANVFTLDFGSVNNSSTDAPPVMVLSLTNIASGPADTLAGTFLHDGSSFTYGNFDAFSGILAGNSLGGLSVTLDNSANGSFSGSITLAALSENNSGYSGSIGSYTINVTGTVVPEPSSMILLMLGGAGLLRYRHRRLNAASPE